MVKRNYNKSRYIIVLVLTLAIFTIGILIGIIISGERASYIKDENRLQRLNYDSLQLQYFYLQSVLSKNKDCDLASKALEEEVSNLGLLGDRLNQFIKDANADTNELNLLKREYTLAELRYWFLLSDVRETCKDDVVSILYFYSNNDCSDCRTQGVILSFLKDKFKERLLIFSLDSDFTEEPLLGLVKRSFNITKSPTLIISGDKIEGFIDKDKLLNNLCSKYNDIEDVKECSSSGNG